ncbi:MAG: DUF2752 domain-containing protein [Chthoniobacterales bacterium]
MNPPSTTPLHPSVRRWRALYLFALPAALLALALVPPGSIPSWFPFATSCGAVTGLPCIFCGTTRALQYLLHGDFARALYYNWLVYPLLAAACALFLVHALELCTARNLLAAFPRPRMTGRPLGALAAGFFLLWCFQVYLAVSQHKTELLNPRGTLYSLVVR